MLFEFRGIQTGNNSLQISEFKLIANSITYPLAVVTTVSCISGCGLVAGQPPKMAKYNSWVGVFKHLYETVSAAFDLLV